MIFLLTIENFLIVSLKLLVIASLVLSVLLLAKISKEGSHVTETNLTVLVSETK